MARTWLMICMSRPAGSCSCRYILTLVISCASWGRYASSQNTTGMPELRARVTASLTQSRMAASLTWHMRQMSPACTLSLSSTSPVARAGVFGLAQAPDVPGLHVLAQQHFAGGQVGDVGHAVLRELESLVVRAVFLRLLRHQPHI